MFIKIPLGPDTKDCFSIKADVYETVGFTRGKYDEYAKRGLVDREILWGNIGDVTVLHVQMPVQLSVAFDGVAYVCNDDGQTMERITNKGHGHLKKQEPAVPVKGPDAVAEERGIPRVLKPRPNPPEVP